jgi:hypothetical protein
LEVFEFQGFSCDAVDGEFGSWCCSDFSYVAVGWELDKVELDAYVEDYGFSFSFFVVVYGFCGDL